MSTSDVGFQIALQEARDGLAENGVPVGSSIIAPDGKTVLGRGRNMRKQNGSPILHGETAAFDSNRELATEDWAGSTIYTTLSPCPMCAGAMIWFKVKKVVIGDSVHMSGREELLRSHGIEVVDLDDDDCKALMTQFQEKNGTKF